MFTFLQRGFNRVPAGLLILHLTRPLPGMGHLILLWTFAGIVLGLAIQIIRQNAPTLPLTATCTCHLTAIYVVLLIPLLFLLSDQTLNLIIALQISMSTMCCGRPIQVLMRWQFLTPLSLLP